MYGTVYIYIYIYIYMYIRRGVGKAGTSTENIAYFLSRNTGDDESEKEQRVIAFTRPGRFSSYLRSKILKILMKYTVDIFHQIK